MKTWVRAKTFRNFVDKRWLPLLGEGSHEVYEGSERILRALVIRANSLKKYVVNNGENSGQN